MKINRTVCRKCSKFMTFKKFSLLKSQESDSTLQDNIEFVLNHEEN